MKLTIISDLHGKLIKLNGIILNAGDFLPYGAYGKEAKEIYKKIFSLVNGEMYFVLGNVDLPIAAEVASEFENIHFLDNEIVDLDGIKLLGINTEYDPKEKFDILLVHYPPYGYVDKNMFGEHVGSKFVLNLIKKYQPKYCICGHIHEAFGKAKIGNTIVINTAKHLGEIEI